MGEANPAQGSREAAMVVIRRDKAGKPTVWCDPEIVDLVEALQPIGTVASCSGHGGPFGNVALKDGRELIIAADFDAARAIERAVHLVRRIAQAPKAACAREETAWDWWEAARIALTPTSQETDHAE